MTARRRFFDAVRGSLLTTLVLFACTAAGRTEEPVPPSSAAEERRIEYDRVAREISLSAERVGSLAAEIEKIKKDQESITAALIQSAKTERKLSQDIEDIADRVASLKQQEAEVKHSLAGRRGVLAEVLGALQRMGLNPPPALLVTPDDALASVRSAVLLGAVVPELRRETDRLLADLGALARVAASIDAERDRLSAAFAEQLAERQRLDLLVAEKRQLQRTQEAELGTERERSEALADKAHSLKELIASLEKQAAEDNKARLAALEKARRDEVLASVPVPEVNQLAASAPFSALKGQIALPVTGKISRRYGADDGNGGVMLGDMVATQSTAIVTAPSDGNVLYAGPFRSYGQLLILNAGDGYHVVLAGMSRISVAPGKSVLAGEPVGAMGEARVASVSAQPPGNTAPELYVEFRKDGKPVDPASWWSERHSGRTGNGT